MSAPLAYVAVIAIWSTTPLAIKLSNHSLSPFAAVASRMSLAALLACVLVAVAFSRSGLKRENWKLYLAASIGVFPNMPLVYAATQYIPSGLVSMLFALAPFSMGLMSILILRVNPFTPAKLLGLLIALGGLLVVSREQLAAGGEAWIGVLLMIGSTMLFSLSNVLVKRFEASVDAFEQTLGALVFSLPGLLLCWWLMDGSVPAQVDNTSLLAVLYLAVVGSLLGFFAFYYVLKNMPVQAVALVPLITPVLAVALGAGVAHESISQDVLLGSALILSGLIVHELYPVLRKIPGRVLLAVKGAMGTELYARFSRS